MTVVPMALIHRERRCVVFICWSPLFVRLRTVQGWIRAAAPESPPAREKARFGLTWRRSMTARRVKWAKSAAIALLGAAPAACASHPVPDPKGAADAFARAAAAGDADGLYGMMTASAQKERSLADVRQVVRSERAELADEGRALASKDARVEATARVRFEDGEEAALDLDHGRFAVTSAGALPGGARTPEEALDQLRRCWRVGATRASCACSRPRRAPPSRRTCARSSTGSIVPSRSP